MITVNANEWNNAVKANNSLFKTKVSNPIIENAVLEWDGRLLTLSSTNLSESIRVTLPVHVSHNSQPFSVAIDKKRLSKLTGKKNETVSFQLGMDNFIDISIGNFTQSIETISTEDFPPFVPDSLNKDNLHSKYLFRSSQFIDKLPSVVNACSNERARYNLGCVHIESDRLVATDGKRLYMAFHSMDLFQDEKEALSLPMGSCESLIKLHKLYKVENCEMKWDFKRIWILAPDFSYCSTVCEENFPPYKPLFTDPDNPTHNMIRVCTVNSKSLLDILKAQEPTINERSHLTQFSFENGSFLVQTIKEGKTIFESTVHGCLNESEDIHFQTCYNSFFIQDSIKSCNSEYISFYFLQKTDCPILISPTSHNFYSMVMPMSIRENEEEIEGITFTVSQLGIYHYGDKEACWNFNNKKGFWECFYCPYRMGEKNTVVTGETILDCISQVFSQFPDLDSTLSEYLPLTA